MAMAQADEAGAPHRGDLTAFRCGAAQRHIASSGGHLRLRRCGFMWIIGRARLSHRIYRGASSSDSSSGLRGYSSQKSLQYNPGPRFKELTENYAPFPRQTGKD
jgi:hypothetical protein